MIIGVLLILLAFIFAIVALIFKSFDNDAEGIFGMIACILLFTGVVICI
jgi:hypothetical protein